MLLPAKLLLGLALAHAAPEIPHKVLQPEASPPHERADVSSQPQASSVVLAGGAPSVHTQQVAVSSQAAASGRGAAVQLSAAPVSDASITWMMLSTAIVMMMTPGLGLFEAGLLPSSLTVSILMQCFAGLAILSVMWFMLGFSLCFGASAAGVIGSPASFPFMDGVSWTGSLPEAPQIPGTLYALFQCMFAVISPLLITGAFAERLKFSAFCGFIMLWSLLVYYPLVHWIWNLDGWLAKYGCVDFAGGIVIHTSAGTASLVSALVIGGRDNPSSRPHSLPLAATGGVLLWVGWFGFNGGSALAAGSLASSAIFSTHIAACSSCVVWIVYEAGMTGKPTLLGAMNGAIAGLAGITPASGFVTIQSAFVLGIVFGAVSRYLGFESGETLSIRVPNARVRFRVGDCACG
jgi:ammonium transporter, Amt family